MSRKLKYKKGDLVKVFYSSRWRYAVVERAFTEFFNMYPYKVRIIGKGCYKNCLTSELKPATLTKESKLIKIKETYAIATKKSKYLTIGCTRVPVKLILELANFYTNKK